MCVAWSALEWRLFCLFTIMSDTPVAVARATFYSHHATSQRAAMVQATAGMALRGSVECDAALADLDALLRKIGRTGKKRNAYIHDLWAMEPGKPETVSQFQLSGTGIHGTGKRVTKRDISQLTDQIDEWTAQLRIFYDRIVPLLPASLGKLDRTRSLTLVFAPTNRPRGAD